MGCDIHLYTEKFNQANQSWEALDSYYTEDEGTPDEYYAAETIAYVSRNYNLFGAMAGVRSFHVPRFVENTDDRGIPDDASPEFKKLCESWGSDGHSHSWLTFEEILAKDLNEELSLTGYFDSSDVPYAIVHEIPPYYMPNLWQNSMLWGTLEEFLEKHRSELELPDVTLDRKDLINNRLKMRIQSILGNKVISHTWTQTLGDVIGKELYDSIVKVREQHPDTPTSELRFVFFFDN